MSAWDVFRGDRKSCSAASRFVRPVATCSVMLHSVGVRLCHPNHARPRRARDWSGLQRTESEHDTYREAPIKDHVSADREDATARELKRVPVESPR
jgi:hypothetical protein